MNKQYYSVSYLSSCSFSKTNKEGNKLVQHLTDYKKGDSQWREQTQTKS